MPELAVVVPTLNEKDNVLPMVEALGSALDGIDYGLAPGGTFTQNTGVANGGPQVQSSITFTLTGMTGSASRIDFRELPQDDPIQRRPDIALAREKLGWEPRVPLTEGLKKTIAYFQKVL